MQGLITLDFGNSHPHAGLFQKVQKDWQLLKVVPLSELSIYLPQFQMGPENTSMVLCDVKSREDELNTFIEQGYLLTRIKEYWRGDRFSGMPVHYATTLGEDRLVEAYYVYKKLKIPALVIDAGTFVTMDVVTPKGFAGGYIIPGIQNYFQLFEKGEKLKNITLTHDFTLALPQTTAAAMTESYTAFAALARTLARDHQLEKIILTGGNAIIWQTLLTNLEGGCKVEIDQHLIHSSMHYWFTTQIEPT